MQIENKILYILFNYQEKQAFIFENLESRFFNDSLNSLIFDKAKEMFIQGQEVDISIINEDLKDDRITERLYDIASDFALSVQTQAYCKTIFKKYLQNLIKEAKTKEDFENISELKNHYLFKDEKILHISSNIENFDKEYKNMRNSAVYTYYSNLDNVIGSFQGGDYITLGAGTGMGKTAIALNFSRQVCIQDRHVLYFSLEMPLRQLQNRFVCMNEGLSANKFRTFGFDEDEMAKYKQGLKNLAQWNLDIVCDYHLTPEKMRFYIQQQKRKGLDFAVLDYLGLMGGYGNKNSYERISLISRKIKLLAGEFNIPILVLLQLNRDLKTREDKRPKLSDIRDSGAIEQDSDFVLFAHREGYYNSQMNANELEICVAKNRHGQNNKIIKLDFNLETQFIRELA